MFKKCKLLLRSAPTAVVMSFVMSVVLMNILANKEIATGVSWLALDCGMLVSWMSFFSMDIITKRFGAQASMLISVIATLVNLVVCAVLFVASKVPGNWSAYYSYADPNVNAILDSTIGGTWYVLLGSSTAFLVSSVVNALTNVAIGKLCRQDTLASYIARSLGSTMLAQFVDNMLFAAIVSHTFFGWTWVQCATCALTGCGFELLCQAVFTPAGYRITQKWQAEGVGSEYLEVSYESADYRVK